MGLFGKDKKADPKEQVNEWSRKIRKEINWIAKFVKYNVPKLKLLLQ